MEHVLTYDEVSEQLDALPFWGTEEERQEYRKQWLAILERAGWSEEEWEEENDRRVGLMLDNADKMLAEIAKMFGLK